MKIIIIEAEPASATLLQGYLGQLQGCTTEVATDPADILARDAQNAPDVIVLDGEMPQALTMLEDFRRQYSGVPVLISLTKFDAGFCFRAIEAGAADFLRKPWDQFECYARLRNTLAQRRCQVELDKRTGWLLDEVNEAYQAMEINAVQAQEMVEIAQTNLELEEASRAKNDFLARVSHDLRAPLTTILGYSSLLAHKANFAGFGVEFSAIQRNAHVLLSLIDDLLDFARGTMGAVRVTPEPVALRTFVGHLMQQAEVLARESGNEAAVELVEPLPQAVEFDPLLVNRVLSNFLSNASKFTRGGKLSLRLTGVSRGSEWTLTFDVSDTGSGIAFGEQNKIFEPYYRMAANTNGIRGSGLGLAICHQLAGAMGGGVSVQSVPGQGSCFTLLLPCPESVCVESIAQPERIAAGSGQRILLVDDDPGARLRLASLPDSYLVTCAGNGLDALSLLQEVRPDVVITDQFMPLMDGWALLRELRMRCTLPVILLSSTGPVAPAGWPEKMCFDACLLKSDDHASLLSALARVQGVDRSEPGISVPDAAVLKSFREWAEHGAVSVLDDEAGKLAISHPEYGHFAMWVHERVDALDLMSIASCCTRMEKIAVRF